MKTKYDLRSICGPIPLTYRLDIIDINKLVAEADKIEADWLKYSEARKRAATAADEYLYLKEVLTPSENRELIVLGCELRMKELSASYLEIEGRINILLGKK